MSLGAALLHPNRLASTLEATAQKRGFDAYADIVGGALGVRGAEDEIAQALTDQARDLQDFAERMQRLFRPGAPLAGLATAFRIDPTDPQGIARALDTVCDVVERLEPDQLRALIGPVADAVIDALPPLDAATARRFLTSRLDALLGILRQPLRSGRKDVAAIKAYRAAMALRCLLDPLYAILDDAGDVDLRETLRGVVSDMLDGIEEVDLGAIRALVGRLKTDIGGLLSVVLSCAGAGGGGVAAGAQTMPGAVRGILHDRQAAPHTLDDDAMLWAVDLGTNILSVFNLIWELNRVRPFRERGFDGAMSVLLVLWEVARTVVRAVDPDSINRPVGDEPGADDAGRAVVDFLFGELGTTSVHLFVRLFTSIVYEAGDASTNWALMVLPRWLQYIANTFNARMWYQFVRSVCYFDAFKRENERRRRDGEEEIRRMPLGRWLMGTLPILWAVCGIVGGAFMPWKLFEAEEFTSSWPLAILIIVPLVMWLVPHAWISHLAGLDFGDSLALPPDLDWPVLIAAFLAMVILFVTLIITVLGLESSGQTTALVALGCFGGVFLICFLALAIGWGVTSDPTEGSGGLAAFGLIFNLAASLGTGMLAMVSWWFIIDDGRDKEDAYAGLDPDATPYLLPIRKDENWFCGQGFHGVFSHVYSSDSNHYAIDLNEAPYRDGLAARDGIVTSVESGNPNDLQEENTVLVLHSEWSENADPGAPDERVLTYSMFVHTARDGVRARPGQTVTQGYHLTEIDSTGHSAVHHTHFAGVTGQKEGWWTSLPVLFGDDSIKARRVHPFLPGHISGKPISFVFYVGDNEERPVTPNARTAETSEETVTTPAGAMPHRHRVIIERDALSGDTIPASLTLRTDAAAGHFHRIELDADQLAAIFAGRTPEAAETDEVEGHRHRIERTLIFETVRFRTESVEVSVSRDKQNHRHFLTVGFDFAEENAIPAAGLPLRLSSRNFFDPSSTLVHAHHHDVTLLPADFDAIRTLGRPTPTTGAVQATGGTALSPAHTHGFAEIVGVTDPARDLAVSLTDPPPGHLFARNAGPYDVLGQRMTLRVDDRATEWYLFGAVRSRLEADIPADRGFLPSGRMRIDTGMVALPPGARRVPVRETLAEINRDLRAGAPRHAAVRAEPVMVLETRHRGSDARLDLTGGSFSDGVSSLLDFTGAPITGSGAFGDLGAVPRADLGAHFDAILTGGWPLSGAVTHGVTADRLDLALSGAAVPFGAGNNRLSTVVETLYDASANRLRATGPLPLGPGRIALDATTALPLLATAARVDIAAPAAGDTLRIRANDTTTEITVRAAGAADTARQIGQEAEGVRAWDAAGRVIVETISAGTAAELEITHGATTTSATGDAQATPATGDLAALTAAELDRLLAAAVAQTAAAPGIAAAIAAATPRADIFEDTSGPSSVFRLRLRVTAPARLTLAEVVLTGGGDPFNFTNADPQTLLSDGLPDPVALPGAGWVSVEIAHGAPATTQVVVIPLDAEPARLDLAPTRLPRAGETLELDIDGAPLTVTFDADKASVAEMADFVAAAAPDLSVRIAPRFVFEETIWGLAQPLGLTDTAGGNDMLALAGVLAPRPVNGSAGMHRARDLIAFGDRSGRAHDEAGALQDLARLALDPGTGQLELTAVAPAATLGISAVGSPFGDPLNFPFGAAATLTSPVSAATALGAPTVVYTLEAQDAAGARIGRSFAQIAAIPAIARSTEAAQLPLPGTPRLRLRIVHPTTGPGPEVLVDLEGATTLDEVAARINAAHPGLRAWVPVLSVAPHAVRGVGIPTGDRLHVETRGGGTGWRLQLSPLQVVAGLGFALPSVDDAATALEVAGRGVVDGDAVTTAEFQAALAEAVAAMTRSDTGLRVGPGADGRLDLASTAGDLEIVTEPPWLATQLSLDISDPATVRIGPPQPAAPAAPAAIAVDSGRVLLRRGGTGVGAVEIIGGPAVLRAGTAIPTAPAAVAALLTQLRSHALKLSVDGGTLHTLPTAAAGDATIEDALATISGAALGGDGERWWIGLVEDRPGGSRFCVIESMTRGTSSAIELDLANFAPIPGTGILGFSPTAGTTVTASGTGTVADLDALHVGIAAGAGAPTLESLFATAIATGGARQAVVAATADTSATPNVLRLRGSLPQIRLTPFTLSGIRLSRPAGAPAGQLEGSVTGAPPLDPQVVTLGTEDTEILGVRDVRAAIHGEPARLTGMQWPGTLTVLDRRRLALEIGPGPVTRTVTLAVSPSTTRVGIARQIERGTDWRVRVRHDAAGLSIETRDRGAAPTLALLPCDAVTGNPATGFTTPVTRRASGSVPRLAAVSAADMATVLQNGMIEAATTTARSDALTWSLDGSAYDAPRRDRSAFDTAISRFTYPVRPLLRSHLEIRSRRSGCASSVVPVEVGGTPLLAPAFAMDRSLERGPAVRAALVLPPFPEQTLSGTLRFTFNENGGRPDMPVIQAVDVDVPGASYDPARLARLIDTRLRAAGVGAAQAHADGSLAVETWAAGIGGTVRLAGGGLAETLLPGGGFASGWPDAGRGARRPGFRSAVGPAAADATWRFETGIGAARFSVTRAITAGQTLAQIARDLEAAFLATPTGGGPARRIAHARIGADNALYIESAAGPLEFAVIGASGPVEVPAPSRIGGTPERAADPAVGLRRTDEPRTMRMLYDRHGRGLPADNVDFGWVRVPANSETGSPEPLKSIPAGRYLALLRADAAKIDNYAGASDMFVTAGQAAGRPVIPAARYWLAWGGGLPLGLGFAGPGNTEPALLIEWPRR